MLSGQLIKCGCVQHILRVGVSDTPFCHVMRMLAHSVAMVKSCDRCQWRMPAHPGPVCSINQHQADQLSELLIMVATINSKLT